MEFQWGPMGSNNFGSCLGWRRRWPNRSVTRPCRAFTALISVRFWPHCCSCWFPLRFPKVGYGDNCRGWGNETRLHDCYSPVQEALKLSMHYHLLLNIMFNSFPCLYFWVAGGKPMDILWLLNMHAEKQWSSPQTAPGTSCGRWRKPMSHEIPESRPAHANNGRVFLWLLWV